MLDRTYIEERCQAYILSKAAQLGAPVTEARVTARWEEDDMVWYPWTVTLDCPRHAALAGLIEGELGIPAERQEWSADG